MFAGDESLVEASQTGRVELDSWPELRTCMLQRLKKVCTHEPTELMCGRISASLFRRLAE